MLLQLIVAIILIVLGVGWALLCFAAAGMASREVDTVDEVFKPAMWGLIPIGLGLALLIW